MYNYLLSAILFVSCSNLATAQSAPLEIIQKSINYHDPSGLIKSGKIMLDLIESRPNGSDRKTIVELDDANGYAKIVSTSEGIKKEMQLKKGKPKFKLDGKRKISDTAKKKHRLSPDRLLFMKNYYRYLWLLPMTLEDNGTIIGPDYNIVDFFGKTCIEIKITYDPQVGNDIWYVYFNPETYAMEGYRFYHDEQANDGEYILLSGSTNYKTLNVPAERQWYTHKEAKHLGTDKLVGITIK